jgi:hypothetical protein
MGRFERILVCLYMYILISRENYYFHELYRDNGEYGCNPTVRPEICVPECRYYNETGRFEDDELVAEHKKMVEFYNKHNAISEIEIRDNDFCINFVKFHCKQARLYDLCNIHKYEKSILQ